jgi:hypothetical protein
MKTSPEISTRPRDIRTENPEGTSRGRDVHADESGDALRLAVLGHLQHVLLAREGEVLAVDGDRHHRERGDLLAVDDGLISMCRHMRVEPRP